MLYAASGQYDIYYNALRDELTVMNPILEGTLRPNDQGIVDFKITLRGGEGKDNDLLGHLNRHRRIGFSFEIFEDE